MQIPLIALKHGPIHHLHSHPGILNLIRPWREVKITFQHSVVAYLVWIAWGRPGTKVIPTAEPRRYTVSLEAKKPPALAWEVSTIFKPGRVVKHFLPIKIIPSNMVENDLYFESGLK
ncbi:MAG: hypothetical protein JW836_08915 [Deltaproteobacteria bacterium]|nr:hypothetical protein [Deltaproteobacteria bacterium]